MSQSSDLTNNTKNPSASSMKAADVVAKANEINAERIPKRAIPDEQKDVVKKIKIEQQSVRELIASTIPKFITATQVASAGTVQGIQAMPEISDEELLEMALQFEKEHPY